MAIAVAVQKGNMVYVYDEKNHTLWSKSGELYGYTSSVVTIKKGNMLYMYDEKNRSCGSRSCY